ncbi:glucosamine-6-phosphate deaminase [Gracilibacillus oryzae]|uniref:Glucosamine-6-phosphate deaminase n=1 Tax=Gracilibacillus oryzae TaxID=1672701 RepID=A0A7C8KSR2_9BACI|nr:glucosamine-6-phosphate deaminase [Gracilibacillus oryzae]KAB8137809.1 glucosamine-6-phosphate deaminase [Gracilibacillus oryzae]
MKIMKAKNYSNMSKIAKEIIADTINGKSDATLGLATGSTPIGLYKGLINLYNEKQLSFQNVTTFNLDEYVGLTPSNPNSYHYFMNEQLFQHIDIKEANIHIPNGMAPDLQEECDHYEQSIKNAGGIDLQILGIGENGHIGFNEPGTSFAERTHIITLDQSTREANARFFETIDQVPTKAITAGIETIMQSKQILLLVSGEAKKEAYNQLLEGEITEEFPASVLHQHENCVVIVDKGTVLK